MTAQALLATHWPEMYARGLIAVREPAPQKIMDVGRERARLDRAKRDARRKAAGQCVRCGCPAIPGKPMCEKHAAAAQAYMRKYREKIA